MPYQVFPNWRPARWPSKISYSCVFCLGGVGIRAKIKSSVVLHRWPPACRFCSSCKTRGQRAARPACIEVGVPIARHAGTRAGRAVGQVDVSDRALVCKSRLVVLFLGPGIQHKFSRPESRGLNDCCRTLAGVGAERMMTVPQHGSVTVVGDHHDVGLIENAIGPVCVENFCNEGIGYGFEVGEFHLQRIGGEMRVQIDSRKVDN